MSSTLIIQDSYTYEIYERLKIKDNHSSEIQEIIRKYDMMHVLYSKRKKKYFKEFRKDGTPIFTDDLAKAKLFNIDGAYINRIKVIDYLHDNPDKKYLDSIIYKTVKNENKDSDSSYQISFKELVLTVSQVFFNKK